MLVGPATPLGLIEAGGDDCGLLDDELTLTAETLTGGRGVRWQHEVRHCPLAVIACQVKHPRAERGQHDRRELVLPGDNRRCGRHRGEVGGHLLDRLSVDVTAHPLDQRRMRYPEAEHKPAGVRRVQCARRCCARHSVTPVDVRDPCPDAHALAGGQNEGCRAERLAAVGLAEPQRRPALLVQLGRHQPKPTDRHPVEAGGPHTYRVRLHTQRLCRTV